MKKLTIIIFAMVLSLGSFSQQSATEKSKKDSIVKTLRVLDSRQAGTTVSSDIRISCRRCTTDNPPPLVIVDGVEIDFENINTIDPHQIKSLDVLRDSVAIAKIGERGFHGVIVITMKQKEVRKLPSRVTRYVGDSVVSFSYYAFDEQNRLIEVTTTFSSPRQQRLHGSRANILITYNSEGLPTQVKSHNYSTIITYYDSGRTIVLSRDPSRIRARTQLGEEKFITLLPDTIFLNEKGQRAKLVSVGITGRQTIRKFYTDSTGRVRPSRIIENGNVYDLLADTNRARNYTVYSEIPCVWRHVNMPEWFRFWLGTSYALRPLGRGNYLPLRHVSGDSVNEYTYELDDDNYVVKMQRIWGAYRSFPRQTDTYTIEYILVR